MRRISQIIHPEQERSRALRGLFVGVCISLGVHGVMVVGAPKSLFASQDHSRPKPQPMNVEYLPPAEKALPEYVETNPAVVQNKPDETLQESSRDQQAAEQDPDLSSLSQKPSVDGEEEDSPKIVDGRLEEESALPIPPGIYNSSAKSQGQNARSASEASSIPAPRTPPPPPDFIKQKPVDEDGIGSTLKEQGEHKKREEHAERVIEITRTGEFVEVTEQAVDKAVQQKAAAKGLPVPKARPTLKFRVPPGPTMRQPIRASRMGVVSIDAKYSQFGEYMQRMVEAVSEQWELLGHRSNLADGNLDTRVVLTFSLDKSGRVEDMQIAYSNATRAAQLLCQDAVISRSPYGEWTREMVNALGEDLPITFTFHYR